MTEAEQRPVIGGLIVAPIDRSQAASLAELAASLNIERVSSAGALPETSAVSFVVSRYSIVKPTLRKAISSAALTRKLLIFALDEDAYQSVQQHFPEAVVILWDEDASDECSKAIHADFSLPTPDTRQTDRQSRKIFVSYSSADHDMAVQLMAWFRGQGWTPWLFQRSDRDSSVSLNRELGKRIAQADAMAFLLSPSWFNSDWCQDEADHGYRNRKPKLLIRVRKLRKSDEKSLSEQIYLGSYSSVDLSGHQSEGYRDLAARLRTLLDPQD